MYRYDDIDRTLVAERVAQFRDQTRRFLAGELTRGRIPSAAPAQRPVHPEACADAAGRDSLWAAVHAGSCACWRTSRASTTATTVTSRTRQNIQYNWPKLEDVPDILADLASGRDACHPDQRQLHPQRHLRSPGRRRADELDDPRPYCEIIRQWSTLHPEFTYLPRKFKIAVTGSPADRAASEVHDIGLHMRARCQRRSWVSKCWWAVAWAARRSSAR